jgi:hypothetical protein
VRSQVTILVCSTMRGSGRESIFCRDCRRDNRVRLSDFGRRHLGKCGKGKVDPRVASDDFGFEVGKTCSVS